jgi:translation initiation factor IF-1
VDHEYWLDKADIWIENSIKESKMAKKCQNKGENDGKISGKVVKTRNWVTRMGKRLDAQKKSAQNEQSTIAKRFSRISKRSRI